MLASWRAELLVLRKSRVAWALVLTAPLIVLVETYVFQFVDYLGLSPLNYAAFGTPAQDLPMLLPGQFAIQTVNDLGFTAPFILLGAVIAGADWGRGTLKTSLLQGQGRVRSFAGQTLAIMTALAASVAATFALAAIASLLIRWYAGGVAAGADGAFPSASVVGEAVGAGLLVAFAYGALGVALGTLCRSAAGGVAAALLWWAFVEEFLYQLSINAGGWFNHLYDVLPGASSTTLTSMFGSPGGGASSATYQPVSPWVATGILLGYTLALLGLALILLRRRDVAGAARWQLTRRRARRATRRSRMPVAGGAGAPGGAVLASLRSELLVMSRWPTMWAFVLIVPVFTLLDGYVAQYILYLNAGTGAIVLASKAQVLSTILPGQFVPAVLNSIGDNPTLPGTAAFFLIGALAGGSNWADGTIKTALTQGPARARTSLGQALAVAVAAVVSVLVTFTVAGLVSTLTALGVSGSISSSASPLPAPGRLAAGVGLAVVVAVAWSAAGWAAGTFFKSATGAFAVILLWTTIVQRQLDQFATELTGPLRAIYYLLPDAATNTLTGLLGIANMQDAPGFLQVAPALAVLTLAIYALACFVLPVMVTRRRNVI